MSIFDRIFQKKQKKSKQKRAEPPTNNPAVLLGRQLADSLREKIPDTATLPEILTYFEEMCRIPVENVEIQDDLITCITDPLRRRTGVDSLRSDPPVPGWGGRIGGDPAGYRISGREGPSPA